MAALVVGWLTIVENTGLPAARLLADGPALFNGVEQVEQATGWLLGAVLATVVGLLACATLSWRGAVGLLVLELVVQLPVTLTSATNAQRSHDIAGDALTLHALGAVLWLGSTLAVLTLLGSGRPGTDVLLRRHAVIAGWALPVVAVSGLISAAYAIAPLGPLVCAGYGRLVGASVLLVAGLVPLARWLRRLANTGWPVRLLLVELGLLALASALGTGLTRLIPPAQVGYDTSRLVYLLGYDLPPHLRAADLVLRWRPDLVFGPFALVAAGLYLLGVRRLRWPVGHACG